MVSSFLLYLLYNLNDNELSLSNLKQNNMGLDYNWTCPIIDEGISDAKHAIETTLRSILEEQEIPEEKINAIVGLSINCIYDDVQHVFEGLRSTNEDMRSAADDQLDEKDREISELEEACNEKDQMIYDLEEEKKELAEQIADLESDLNDLQSEAA